MAKKNVRESRMNKPKLSIKEKREAKKAKKAGIAPPTVVVPKPN